MAVTFDNWVKNNLGKKIDADGVYGVQCVDLIKHYCINVLGIKKRYTDAWGNAIDWYNSFGSKSWLTANFIRIANTADFVPQKGDVAVFKTGSANGHIAVCNGVGDTKSFQAYDENFNGTGAGMVLRIFSYSGARALLGVLRPKNQSNIMAEPVFKAGNTYTLKANIKVRAGSGTNYSQKKISQLTADGRKNCKSTNPTDYAVLKSGTRVTVKTVKRVGRDIWLEIPSGWICAYCNGNIYVK